MKMLLPITVCLVLCASAAALIGETVDQCKARYGTVLKEDTTSGFKSLHFTKAGFEVSVLFDGDVAGALIYRRPNEEQLQFASPELSRAEIDKLLAANTGGGKWTPLGGHLAVPSWKTEDGKRHAEYRQNGLMIITTEMALKMAERKARPGVNP